MSTFTEDSSGTNGNSEVQPIMTESWRYRICSMCSVNWILTKDNEKSFKLIAVCDKCRKTISLSKIHGEGEHFPNNESNDYRNKRESEETGDSSESRLVTYNDFHSIDNLPLQDECLNDFDDNRTFDTNNIHNRSTSLNTDVCSRPTLSHICDVKHTNDIISELQTVDYSNSVEYYVDNNLSTRCLNEKLISSFDTTAPSELKITSVKTVAVTSNESESASVKTYRQVDPTLSTNSDLKRINVVVSDLLTVDYCNGNLSTAFVNDGLMSVSDCTASSEQKIMKIETVAANFSESESVSITTINDHISTEKSSNKCRMKVLSGISDICIGIGQEVSPVPAQNMTVCVSQETGIREPDQYLGTPTHSSSKYTCSFCFQQFAVKAEMLKHKKLHRPDPSEKCGICQGMCNTEALLQQHYRCKHSDSSSELLVCRFCPYTTTCRYVKQFIRHIRLHSGEKPYVCTQCGKRCLDKIQLVAHIRSAHINERSKKTLSAQQITIASNGEISQSTIEAAVVPRYFSSSTSSQSESLLTTSIRQSDCENSALPAAPIMIVDLPVVDQPLKISSLSKISRTCNMCRERFTENLKYIKHQHLHRPDTHERCSICEIVCDTELLLMRHYRCKHRDEFSRSLACKFCCYTTTYMQNFINHIRVHTGEKPYVCLQCEKRCMSKLTLRRHISSSHQSKHTRMNTRQAASAHQAVVQQTASPSRATLQQTIANRSQVRSPQPLFTLVDVVRPSVSASQPVDQPVNDSLRQSPSSIGCQRFSERTEMNERERNHGSDQNQICNICQETFQAEYRLVCHFKHLDKGRNVDHGNIAHQNGVFNKDISITASFQATETSQSAGVLQAQVALKTASSSKPQVHHSSICVPQTVLLPTVSAPQMVSQQTATASQAVARSIISIFSAAVQQSISVSQDTADYWLTHACSFCSQRFTRRIELMKHELAHRPDASEECAICHENFATDRHSILVQHYLSNHFDPSNLLFSCTFCPFTTMYVNDFITHVRWHAFEKLYACTECGKRCISKERLTEHVAHAHQNELISKVQQVAAQSSIPVALHREAQECITGASLLQNIGPLDPSLPMDVTLHTTSAFESAVQRTVSVRQAVKKNIVSVSSLQDLTYHSISAPVLHCTPSVYTAVSQRNDSGLLQRSVDASQAVSQLTASALPAVSQLTASALPAVSQLTASALPAVSQQTVSAPHVISPQTFADRLSFIASKAICTLSAVAPQTVMPHQDVVDIIQVGSLLPLKEENESLTKLNDGKVNDSSSDYNPSQTIIEVKYMDAIIKHSLPDLILSRIDDSYSTGKSCCHQCVVCPKIFQHIVDLTRHKHTHTDSLSIIEVKYMDAILKHSTPDLILSRIDDSYSTGKSCCHQCLVCPKIFQHIVDLTRHKHTPTDNLSIIEVKCMDAILKHSTPDLILSRIDSTGKSCCHECLVCPKIFQHIVDLTRHEHTHTDSLSYVGWLRDRKHVLFSAAGRDGDDSHWEDSVSCKYCDKKFETTEELVRHVQKTHRNIIIALQTVSDLLEAEDKDLEISMHDPLKYACSFCAQLFAGRVELMKHKLLHKPDSNEMCSICLEIFDTELLLRDHYRSKHCDRTSQLYICIFCPFSTNKVEHFVDHARVHTGEKPYVCLQCDKTYVRPGDLRNHITLTHSEVSKCKLMWY